MLKKPPSFAYIIRLALPVILANAIIPLQGFIDIAVISHLNNTNYLNGLGFATQLFSLIFISFNFLQYATSGFSAQAFGKGNYKNLVYIVIRSLIIALVISLGLFILAPFIIYSAKLFFAGPTLSMQAMTDYFYIRIWGAPAELCIFVCIGWFSGQAKTNLLMRQQIVLVLSNICLSLFFVLALHLNIKGVALGTVLASYIAAIFGGFMILKRSKQLNISRKIFNWRHILNRLELANTFKLNRDIFIRTTILTFSFAWIIRLAGQHGSIVLSSDIILLQILTFCAFALDGVAIVTEGLAGQAFGTKSKALFGKVVKQTVITSFCIALFLTSIIAITFSTYIHFMTEIPAVIDQANSDFYWCLFLPLFGFLAYQFDGVFVGTTAKDEIRKAMIYTAIIFFPSSYLLNYFLKNNGIWLSIYLLLTLRAFWLIYFYPKIYQRLH